MLKKYIFISCTLFLLFFSNCSTLKIGYDILLSDLDGNKLINNEKHVKSHLEEILLTPEKYIMTAFTRQAISPDTKRTPTRFHSFYVVTGYDQEYFNNEI
jgi:hypothetical protein